MDLNTAPLVKEALMRCVAAGMHSIEVDVGALEFCDCAGLNAFLQARTNAAAAGACLRLHRVQPGVARLFALCEAETALLGIWPPGGLCVCGRRVDGGPG